MSTCTALPRGVASPSLADIVMAAAVGPERRGGGGGCGVTTFTYASAAAPRASPRRVALTAHAVGEQVDI